MIVTPADYPCSQKWLEFALSVLSFRRSPCGHDFVAHADLRAAGDSLKLLRLLSSAYNAKVDAESGNLVNPLIRLTICTLGTAFHMESHRHSCRSPDLALFPSPPYCAFVDLRAPENTLSMSTDVQQGLSRDAWLASISLYC